MSEDELPSRLLTLARRDLRAAELLQDQPEVGDGIIGFHFQQAAEKTLKAWLTILGIAAPNRPGVRRRQQSLSAARALTPDPSPVRATAPRPERERGATTQAQKQQR
jgi:HEPN domain-containing protein